ncbi:MerR family transcriptional regulator [Photorhabdus tasmaniensis]|uniref:MerR family transcriptional regulator n=1 Tax=Photorhabdus tasmaniensis TaxID=1004159 RepID=A0ABX0GMC6_9GAMM|nr:MerR family transcriptional regulator [Photorhabdus tasmaniensis]NHB90400.1 MerR family transcriptional regulator [Photorhabdus tasmaniensis]
MRISEFSQKTGISTRMIRYYEKRGLIKPNRTISGYRNFNSQDLVTIQIIQSLQKTGLTLDTIRILMPCIIREPVRLSLCPFIISTLEQHREKIKEALERNSRALLLLDQYLSDLTLPLLPKLLSPLIESLTECECVETHPS